MAGKSKFCATAYLGSKRRAKHVLRQIRATICRTNWFLATPWATVAQKQLKYSPGNAENSNFFRVTVDLAHIRKPNFEFLGHGSQPIRIERQKKRECVCGCAGGSAVPAARLQRAKQRGSPRREEVERETTEPGTQRPLRVREVETQSNPSVARTNRGGWEGKRKRLEEEEELEVDEDEDEAETGNEMWQCRLDIRDLVYTGEIHERSLCLLPLPCLTLRPARKLASPELAKWYSMLYIYTLHKSSSGAFCIHPKFFQTFRRLSRETKPLGNSTCNASLGGTDVLSLVQTGEDYRAVVGFHKFQTCRELGAVGHRIVGTMADSIYLYAPGPFGAVLNMCPEKREKAKRKKSMRSRGVSSNGRKARYDLRCGDTGLGL
ncbi:hypothetical protein C8R46DRAFT_1044488 [Mycena filopes]|nr:hypothetical protein C8R46DRAFT_1044488 [Mycena filopes]